MSKNLITENILATIFKALFKGKADQVEKALNTDPILQKKAKELAKKVNDMTKYIEKTFDGYGE